jgi:putative transposase
MKQLQIPDIDLSKGLNKCKSMEALVGKNGLMQRLFGNIIQQFLEVEMEEHLGRERYERDSNEDKNYRNGYSQNNIKTSFGEVELDVPRDRNAEFEPKIVRKYETVCNELDKKVIGLYSRGMFVDDIKAEIDELYRVDISPAMISKITDKVMETATAWQNRPLEAVYPIVYMDAIHFKVKEEHKIVSKAAYICMALDMKGYKDILGIWIGEQEGAKFWLSVCNDLKNRGVKDIPIACMDGLKGLPEAIKAVFPDVSIQSCIIHQIRNSIKYIASKDSKSFIKDLKCVYQATSEQVAIDALEALEDTWGDKYSIVIQSWKNNWENLSTCFAFPPDDSLRKALYLATEQIMVKWTLPMQNWSFTLAQLSIMFEEKVEQYI